MSLASPKKGLADLGAPPGNDRQTLVRTETIWQKPVKPPVLSSGAPARISLARWSRARLDGPMEVSTEHDDEFHFITYSMIQSDINFTIGRTDVTAGVVVPQLVLLQGPTTVRRRSIYRKPFDFFRIYFPQSLLAECYETAFGRPPPQELVLFGPCFTNDRVTEDLTRSLIDVDEMGGALGPSYVDAVGLALAARVLGQYANPNSRPAHRPVKPLARWRLRRVVEYIEARLTEPIYLAELSEVAGLSRMHFAAQFRAVIGCSPHVYIARRRVAYAQQLLLDRPLAISDIATLVGFTNHAQFSSVFRKVVGTTARQWRQVMIGS